jgi:Holliday junction resolvase RusA-like endonuclease
LTFSITFKIDGEPVPKGRPRFTHQGRIYTPKKTHDYETKVAECARVAMGSSEPLETPVAVFVYVTYAVPSSYSKKRREDCLSGIEKHTKRPDLDNCIKVITDGMNEIVYKDDSQITSIHATKVYGTDSMVEVFIQENLG